MAIPTFRAFLRLESFCEVHAQGDDHRLPYQLFGHKSQWFLSHVQDSQLSSDKK